METQEFWSWPGLKRYFKNTGQFPQFEAQLLELEKLPMKDRKIIVQENGKDVCLQIFIDEETLGQPQPYPSWTWNQSTGQWEPPIPQPSNPVTEYDLLWNEETQGWGLENMSLSKLNDNGTHAVERKYFDTWDNLIKYLHSIDQIKNVYRQIAEQEKLELINRKIISPYHDRFICLKIIES